MRQFLSQAVSIGTLIAFSIVNGGVLVLRYKTENKPHNVAIAVTIFSFCHFALSFINAHMDTNWKYIPIGFFALIELPAAVYIFLQKQENIPKTFVCPGVPLIPLLAIAINLTMMGSIDMESWLRLVVWSFFGFLLYFGYSIRYSALRK